MSGKPIIIARISITSIVNFFYAPFAKSLLPAVSEVRFDFIEHDALILLDL